MFNKIQQRIHLGLKISLGEVFTNEYEYFYKYKTISIFYFHSCQFCICSLYLNCQIYWHKFFIIILIKYFVTLGSLVLLPFHFWCLPFAYSFFLDYLVRSLSIWLMFSGKLFQILLIFSIVPFFFYLIDLYFYLFTFFILLSFNLFFNFLRESLDHWF